MDPVVTEKINNFAEDYSSLLIAVLILIIAVIMGYMCLQMYNASVPASVRTYMMLHGKEDLPPCEI